MSIYSGKCDFYDHIEIFGVEKVMNATIYVGDSEVPLKFESEKDMIPYYPYVIYLSVSDDKHTYMRLTNKSWVEIEEADILNLYLELFLKYLRKCKRKKVEYIVEDAMENVCWYYDEAFMELAKRVKEYGKKATIDGLFLKGKDFYRQKLAEEMIKNGLNLADYGLERFEKRKE